MVSGVIVDLTESNFGQEVDSSDKPVLVDFWASWCGNCRSMAPIFAEFAKKHAANIKVGKLNVDENQATAARYEILSIPTFILFVAGKQAKIIVGAVPLKKLEDEVLSLDPDYFLAEVEKRQKQIQLEEHEKLTKEAREMAAQETARIERERLDKLVLAERAKKHRIIKINSDLSNIPKTLAALENKIAFGEITIEIYSNKKMELEKRQNELLIELKSLGETYQVPESSRDFATAPAGATESAEALKQKYIDGEISKEEYERLLVRVDKQ